MRQLRKLILPFLLLLLPCSANSATAIAKTIEASPAMDAPNGNIKAQIPSGSIVAVLAVKGEWANVLYSKNHAPGSYLSLWVRVKNLALVQSSTAAGDHCTTDYETDSQVCVSVDDTSIDCDENFDKTAYRECTATVEFTTKTDYEGDDFISADIECTVEIKYEGTQLIYARNDSSSESTNVSMYATMSNSDSMEIDFTFSSLNEVNKVNLTSAECEVTSATSY